MPVSRIATVVPVPGRARAASFGGAVRRRRRRRRGLGLGLGGGCRRLRRGSGRRLRRPLLESAELRVDGDSCHPGERAQRGKLGGIGRDDDRIQGGGQVAGLVHGEATAPRAGHDRVLVAGDFLGQRPVLRPGGGRGRVATQLRGSLFADALEGRLSVEFDDHRFPLGAGRRPRAARREGVQRPGGWRPPKARRQIREQGGAKAYGTPGTGSAAASDRPVSLSPRLRVDVAACGQCPAPASPTGTSGRVP